MSDVNIIINQVLADKKLVNSKAFRDRVYKDEPIIRTAAQFIKQETPSEIKEMKNIAFTQEAYWKTSAWLFYTQGKFMENYSDSFSYNEDFTKYYPCYRDMTTEQLRGYFSWRTCVRNGIISKAPLPCVFVYIYELINCIGADTPEKCFFKLKGFCCEYKNTDDSISKYIEGWLLDFIVYNGLDSCLADELHEIKFDHDMLTLMNWKEHDNDEIFSAVSALSAYQLQKSLFYISSPDDMKKVVARCFIKLSEFFEEKRKSSLFSRLFGNPVECNHNMFASAIFYDRMPLRSCEYKLSEIHSYTCKNGRWTCRKIYGNRNRNGHLGDIVKAVDSLMREYNNFRHKISFDGVSKAAIKVIQNEIELYYAEKRRKEAVKIEIDISKLGSIRSASDITREKLLVYSEEENEEENNIAEETITEELSGDLPLDKNEVAFLRAMLYNGAPSEAAQKCGKMVSILADSVNEKLFDSFGDTVIDFSGDEPVLIEDYTDELKTMIPKE